MLCLIVVLINNILLHSVLFIISRVKGRVIVCAMMSMAVECCLAAVSESPAVLEVEQKGITLWQLRAVMVNIIRRCKKVAWTNRDGELLTPKTDTEKYTLR